ncbi:MAG: peptide-methionine (S)-S-oxide reductase MsrA [Actinomycetota bacterium]
MFHRKSSTIPAPEEALPGRTAVMPVPEAHHALGTPLVPPFPDGLERAMFGMGCFWGAEKIFWKLPGVYTTFAGYAGGFTPNASYEEVCTGATGHNEVAVVIYDPAQVTYQQLLKAFWENHDPTQGMRQGNDVGTQYRSGIYTFSDEQQAEAERSLASYQTSLSDKGFAQITTEIRPAGEFYYAEPYHQQYLSKNPMGYCNHGFCQVEYAGEPAG